MANLIKISLSRRTLTLIKDGRLIKTYPVGVGKVSTATPTGNFLIVSKVSNPGGPFGAIWMGLNQPHYGIHGTNNPSSIGGAVSKGCIRMYNQDALELSRMISVGTPVTILY
ncbi:L,D-transpeptidase [Sporomusa termitida]|uniref:L,D-transpeptidase YkuD n=1 Tax=Sporomusa termitida TaxID=2377 RepID=A0A517E0K3_9FIRM|nr:L,D-transpeptidase [Sporomusa termitida]QDR83108.1 Putative L,D-transpeptidase YkuD [Sporomusa termitida]